MNSSINVEAEAECGSLEPNFEDVWKGGRFFFFFFFFCLHQKHFLLCSCDADQQFISHRKSGFYIRNLSWNGSKINRVESSE